MKIKKNAEVLVEALELNKMMVEYLASVVAGQRNFKGYLEDSFNTTRDMIEVVKQEAEYYANIAIAKKEK